MRVANDSQPRPLLDGDLDHGRQRLVVVRELVQHLKHILRVQHFALLERLHKAQHVLGRQRPRQMRAVILWFDLDGVDLSVCDGHHQVTHGAVNEAALVPQSQPPATHLRFQMTVPLPALATQIQAWLVALG